MRTEQIVNTCNTFEDILDKAQIKMEITPKRDFGRTQHNKQHNFAVRVYREKHNHSDCSMSVNYSTGDGHCPSPASVLYSLGIDTQDFYNNTPSPSFEEWAENYGYDTDSRKAEKAFRACRDEYENLRPILGAYHDEFYRLLNEGVEA